jgi:hypothetical protein
VGNQVIPRQVGRDREQERPARRVTIAVGMMPMSGGGCAWALSNDLPNQISNFGGARTPAAAPHQRPGDRVGGQPPVACR